MLEALGLFPEAASTVATSVDALYLFFIAISAVFGIGIAVTLITFAVRFRRAKVGDSAVQIEGSLVLEAVWTIVPFIIAMTMFASGAAVYFKIVRPPDDALEVFVVGKQWMWKLQHMEGRREINELHIPVGRPVKLTMTSEDVIHSFFVPAFRVKADAVPGRYTTLWFEATKTGTFHLFCAEYCGTEHSRMIGRVIALEPHDFQAWLAGKDGVDGRAEADPNASPSELGQQVFASSGCETCHAVAPDPAVKMIGPALAGLYGAERALTDGSTVTADASYLRASILEPMRSVVKGYQPMMPTYRGRLSEEQVMQLVEFIRSLADTDADAGADAGPEDQS